MFKKDKEEFIEEVEENEIEEENEEEEKVKDPNRKYKIMKRISNIFFILIIIIIALISIDYIRVAKYDLKPLFAVNTKTYKDGGTKEYTGILYKVYDYNQIQGRRDIEIGTWSLKYNNKPVTYQDIDLAIELEKNEEKVYKTNYKKFIRITSTLKSINKKDGKLLLGYTDEDGKYSIDIVCNLVDEQTTTEAINKFETNKEITVIGNMNKYKVKTKKNNRRLYIKNCMAEQ